MALLGDGVGREPLDHLIEGEIGVPSLFVRQLADEPLEHLRARVGNRVDRVTYAVDESLAVEGLAPQQLFQVLRDLALVGRVADLALHVLEHLHDLVVRAAVLRALERAERRRNDRIGIRARGGDNVRGERGIVAAAVLHM